MKTSIVFAILCGLLLSACGGSSGESLNKLITPKPKPSSSASSLQLSSVAVSSTALSSSVASLPLSSAESSVSESVASDASSEASSETSSSAPQSSEIASSQGNSSAASSSLAAVQTGVFLDAAVSNLGYRTQSLEGVTNALGEFNYRAGETILFFIGTLEFPAVPVADIITPLDLANTNNPNNPLVINIARLLQSLDSDGDANNGISLSDAAINAAPVLDLTLAPEVFEQLPALLSWLQGAGANPALISVEQALAHLQATLDFIYGPSSSSSSLMNSSVMSSSVVNSSVVSSSVMSSSVASSSVASSESSASSVVVVEPSSSSSQNSSSVAVSSVADSSVAHSEISSSEGLSSEGLSSAASSVANSNVSSSSVESSVATSEISSSDASTSAQSSAPSSEVSSSSIESSVASSEYASSVESSVASSGGSSSAAESSAASSEAPTSAESSSSQSSLSGAIILDESFNLDKATLFSAAYQAISTDANAARYFITGGGSGITIVDNQLSIVGGRLTIGHRPPRTATTAADVTTNGDFDLSRPYRIQFTVASATGTGKIQVYVDNSTTSQGNSLHGADSKVYEVVASDLMAGQVVSITPEVGTETSFIAIRTESSATLVLDSLRVEYLEAQASSSSVASELASSSSVASSVPSSSSSVEASSSSSLVEVISSSSAVSSEQASSEQSSLASSEVASSVESSVASSAESSSIESSVSSSEQFSSEQFSSEASSVASSEESSSAPSSIASSAESSSSEASVSSSEASSSSESSVTSSEEASSSSSSVGIVNTPLPLHEDFNNVVDAAGFFSVDYQVLQTSEAPFYHSLSGTPGFSHGRMSLGNARLSLANTTPATTTTSSDTLTTGELDLSEAYRISFCVIAVQGSGNVQVYVNNNTTGQGNSIHGNASRIYSQAVGTIAVGQRVVINSDVGDSTSFIGLRAESSAQIVIDDLWIGYQADTSAEPAPESCIPPAPVAPAAPQVTAGDTAIAVTWSAVAGATGYEVLYNTVDNILDAVPANNPLVGTGVNITGLSNGTTYYVFVRAINAGGESDFSPSASAVPVVAGEEEEPEPTNNLLLLENFTGATSATFFTAAYKALPNNSALPLYIAMSNGSNAQFTNDQLHIVANTILTMGAVNNTATASGVQPVGVFDLSKPYKIVFDVIANGTGSGKIQIQVDNNTSGSSGSIHGASSRVYDVAAASIAAGTVEINNPTKSGGVPVGTTTSHISIRSEGGTKSVIIDNFRVEYIE